MSHKSAAPNVFAEVITLNCKMLRLPEIFSKCYLPLWLGTQPQNPVLCQPNLAWWCRLLQLEQNFLNHLIIVLWSIAPLTFAQQIFLVVSVLFELLDYIAHSSVWFSNHTRSEAMHYVSAQPTTTILPSTAGTYHGLNCFGHVINTPQTSMYPNIAKLLAHLIDQQNQSLFLNLVIIMW